MRFENDAHLTYDVPILAGAGCDESLQVVHIRGGATAACVVEIAGHDLDPCRPMVAKLKCGVLAGLALATNLPEEAGIVREHHQLLASSAGPRDLMDGLTATKCVLACEGIIKDDDPLQQTAPSSRVTGGLFSTVPNADIRIASSLDKREASSHFVLPRCS